MGGWTVNQRDRRTDAQRDTGMYDKGTPPFPQKEANNLKIYSHRFLLERMEGWMDGGIDGGMEGWTDVGMDGWMDGHKDVRIKGYHIKAV